MRYHVTHIRLATIQKQKIASFVEDVEKFKCLHTVGGKGKWYSHIEDNMAFIQNHKSEITT